MDRIPRPTSSSLVPSNYVRPHNLPVDTTESISINWLISFTIALFAGLGDWLVFAPGMLTPDSLDMLEQAKIGIYHDWHSPTLAWLLRVSLSAGGGIGLLTLITCLTGCTGVFLLADSVLACVFRRHFSPGVRGALALVCMLTILSPISPALFHLPLLSKDSVAAVSFLMMANASLRLLGNIDQTVFARKFWLSMLVGSGLFVPLIRPNSVAVLPVTAFCFYLALVPAGAHSVWKFRRSAFALLFLVGGLCLPTIVHRLLPVKKTHPIDQVIGNELCGLCLLDERMRERMPFVDSYLLDNFRENYEWGSNGPILTWYCPRPIVRHGFVAFKFGDPRNHDLLLRDYLTAWSSRPARLLAIKWRHFWTMITHPSPFWHEIDTVGGKQGQPFPLSEQSASIRAWMVSVDSRVQNHWLLRELFIRHLPWINTTCLGLVMTAVIYLRSRRKESLALSSVFLLSVAYIGGHYLAMTQSCARFLWPAQLLTQSLIVPLALGGVAFLLTNIYSRSARSVSTV